jgi:hypothetical protein
LLRILDKDVIYIKLTENSFIGTFKTPLSKTSITGIKWQINGNSEGDVYKQNVLMKHFEEKLKADSKKFVDNVPQLNFPPLKK